jgi:ankyrin repeat protein
MEVRMARDLPARPNLEQLKKQAKSLLQAAEHHDAEALARFRILPAFSTKAGADLSLANLALHDAQSVIAREHGFASWNALREEVEARTLSLDAAIGEFLRCATGNAPGRAQRLLERFPAIATANLYTAAVLGDAAAVAARLRARPELATLAGGPQGWEPLLYACHTCVHDGRGDELVAIARELCARGADVNGEYHWDWHPELPRTALWAAVCVVRHLPLAEVLLDKGANPTDGVTAHIAGGVGFLPALELLHRFGMNVNGVPGGVPPLLYILLWATDASGPRWLLERGADPNLRWGPEGEAALHVAARRWDVGLVELLAAHGANVTERSASGSTPHTLAELNGNRDVAEWLLAHGARDELSALERFVAACARGDRQHAEAMLAGARQLRTELRREHHLMLQRQAESGNAAVLDTMLACGFDPTVGDKDGVTALHRAAMGGHADAVRVLLAHGASVEALDGMFAAPPLVWAAEGWHNPRHPGDHVAVARLLIAAGSPVEWQAPAKAPDPERTHEQTAELRRAAALGE